jgi:hypothetical protein
VGVKVRVNKIKLTLFFQDEIVDIVLCADGSWAGVRIEVNAHTVDVALFCSSMLRVEFEQENTSAERLWSKFSEELRFIKQRKVQGDERR